MMQDFSERKRQVIRMKNKFWNWSKNEETGERVLRLDGVIHDWNFWDEWFDDEEDDTINTPREFRQELNSATGDIEVYINSPGGNIFSAAEIYTMLKEYEGGKITVKIPSFAASAATIIAMAGDSIEVSPLAVLCIHNPFLDYVGGEEKDMLKAAEYLADLKENVITAYETKTKLSRQKISDLMDAETYMNAQKAVELHFADKIMFEENQQGEEMTAEMYSHRQVLNSLANRFKHSSKPKDKRIDAKNLIHRLNLIS